MSFRALTFEELRSRLREFWARSFSNKLVILNVLVFLAGTLHLFAATVFALNLGLIRDGFYLNFVAYGFLHGSFLHLLLNMLALYFIGNSVERYESKTDFLVVYLGGIIIGGALWFIAVSAAGAQREMLVGASAGIAALLAYFCIANREAVIRAMIFFVLPVKMRAWILFAVALALTLAGLVFYEIPALRTAGTESGRGAIAHSAHLGGLLFGAAYALVAEKIHSRKIFR